MLFSTRSSLFQSRTVLGGRKKIKNNLKMTGGFYSIAAGDVGDVLVPSQVTGDRHSEVFGSGDVLQLVAI